MRRATWRTISRRGASGMAEHRPQFPELESYLDDQMTPEMRARFEALIATDPALRAQVERQREIDGSLRRMFVMTGGADAILSRLMPRAQGGNGRTHHDQPVEQPAPRQIAPRRLV